jgi:hypothetical protein
MPEERKIVVLDSSIINQDRSCEGRDMNLFVKWVSLGLLVWHVPWIIFREVVSKGFLDGNLEIDNFKKNLRDFEKLGQGKDVKNQLFILAEQIDLLKEKYKEKNEEYWELFFQNAVVDNFDCKMSENVLNAYFDGESPFSDPKCRKDIPDAFIYEALKKLTSKYEIFFICADKNLRCKCNELKKVTGYESLSAFENSEYAQLINERYKQIEQSHSKIEYVLLHKDEILKQAEEDVRGDLLVYLFDGFRNIHFPDESEGGLVDIPEIENVGMIDAEIACVDDVTYIPISVKCQFEIEYYMDVVEASFFRNRTISFTDNDFVSELFNASFTFVYSLKNGNNQSSELNLQIPEKINNLVLDPIYRN